MTKYSLTRMILIASVATCLTVACSNSNNNGNDGGTAGSRDGGQAGFGGASGFGGAGGIAGFGGVSGGGAGIGGGGTTGADAAAGGGDAAVATLTDPQIAGVLLAANDGEVQAGTIANARSQNSAVRAFATLMINDHTMANQNLSVALTGAGLVAADSSVRQMLSSQASATVTALFSASVATFDLTYVDSQVTMHTMVLGLLDNTLIPMATNAALKAQLAATRTTVVMHLAAAQELRTTLTSDGGLASDGGADAGAADAATGG